MDSNLEIDPSEAPATSTRGLHPTSIEHVDAESDLRPLHQEQLREVRRESVAQPIAEGPPIQGHRPAHAPPRAHPLPLRAKDQEPAPQRVSGLYRPKASVTAGVDAINAYSGERI